MPQTRMFRDRVVSVDETPEGGEKNLELLKGVCREALPEFTFREHTLDHERDLFVMILEAPDGRTRRVCWTRMTLYDAERIPALTGDPLSPLRARIIEFLRAHASRPEIVVTFRHLEDGWVDTPEPRRPEKKRRRGRGGDRGRREGRREGGQPQAGGSPQRPAARPGPRPGGPPGPPSPRERDRRREGPPPPAAAQAPAGGGAPGEAGKPAGGRRRRRFRRRRGRGPGGAAPPSAPPGPARAE